MGNRRRVDIRGILADPDLRRELMVPTIQATQAREGVETSREQAERAYYVVTEGERATFFGLERFRGGKGVPDRRAEMFERALRGEAAGVRFDVARRDFGTIEGSPLAYERVGIVANTVRDAPQLDPGWGVAVQGLATAADDRFVRHWWEIPLDRPEGTGWVPFAKGGGFSRFYADVYLLVNWARDGEEIKAWICERYEYLNGKWEWVAKNPNLYFKPGLTWPRRTQRGFNLRVLPPGCIFADKGPAVLPARADDTFYLLGVANAALAEYLLQGLMSFGSWEVGVIKRLPVPQPSRAQHERIAGLAASIHDAKASWDEGNQISTRFRVPWLLWESVAEGGASLPSRLDQLAQLEASEEARIQQLYAELNDEVYLLYGIPEKTRAVIEATLGRRPPEVLWPQMEGKSAEQKRMEHVWRLLHYLVGRVVVEDEDGIVPFLAVAGETTLVERVRGQLAAVFPTQDPVRVETEIANELKQTVKGYRRADGIAEWLENAFFDYHCALYKKRPVLWHISSRQGTSPFAFGAVVDYHRFDRNRMAKLRAQYLRDSVDTFRREAALAGRSGQTDARLEWQSRLEEAEDLDRRLQWVQEGHHEGPEGGTHDYRILTPWKPAERRPSGWEPDLDDGVRVNIEPLQKAGILRAVKVV
ncbi:MAG: BREX-1 system adenine-specific DNA-methyltransferase PglX [Thermoleophilia bacterium]